MNQSLRVLKILRELPWARGRSHSTAAALARRFAVSERTIYRDLTFFQEAGYAIANDRQGYYLLPTDQCVPIDLSAGEIASLVYACYWIEDAMPVALRPDLRAVIDKLTAACGSPDALSAALAGDDGMDISPPQTDGPAAAGNMAVAFQARRAGRKLRGIYRSPDRDERTERVLHPYSVTYRGDAHYLVAFCELRCKERTFRLDRFEDFQILDELADIPEGYDLDGHFAGAWEVTSGRRQYVKILVRGRTARRLRSSRLHPSQRVVRKGHNEIELHFHVALTDEFRTWVLGLGPDAVVVKPSSLRKQMAELVENMSANYSST